VKVKAGRHAREDNDDLFFMIVDGCGGVCSSARSADNESAHSRGASELQQWNQSVIARPVQAVVSAGSLIFHALGRR